MLHKVNKSYLIKWGFKIILIPKKLKEESGKWKYLNSYLKSVYSRLRGVFRKLHTAQHQRHLITSRRFVPLSTIFLFCRILDPGAVEDDSEAFQGLCRSFNLTVFILSFIMNNVVGTYFIFCFHRSERFIYALIK